jgi:hypothetical protein
MSLYDARLGLGQLLTEGCARQLAVPAGSARVGSWWQKWQMRKMLNFFSVHL